MLYSLSHLLSVIPVCLLVSLQHRPSQHNQSLEKKLYNKVIEFACE